MKILIIMLKKCAIEYKGAWWYKGCHSSSQNELHLSSSYCNGVIWVEFRSHHYSLKRTEMKIKNRI